MLEFRGLLLEEVLETRREDVKLLILAALSATDAYLDYAAEDVIDMVKSRDAQAWAVFDEDALLSLVLTRITVYPRRKVLEVFLVSGEGLSTWVKGAYSVLVAFAKTHGCEGLRGIGRKGWKRILEAEGPIDSTVIIGQRI